MEKRKLIGLLMLPFICLGCSNYDDGGVKYVAHRGGIWDTTVENTKEAFLMAAEKGFDAIETDVQITKDNVFYCYHDATLKRLNPDFTHSIAYYDNSQIKDIELKEKKGDRFAIGKLCLFTEYLDICKTHDIVPVIELKPTHGINYSDAFPEYNYDNLEPLMEMVKERDLLDKAIIISFMRGPLAHLRKKYKDIQMQWLSYQNPEQFIDWALNLNIGLDLHYKLITKEIIDKVHAKHLKINMWTFNDKDHVKDYIDMGIDYITSDIQLF